mgnify:CR=1 FL=1
MPQVEVTIGGRAFEVACQPGEEDFLRTAAAMLDAEASALSSQIGRMPEARMLLMSGLMLADKTAGLEDRLRDSEARLRATEAELRAARAPAAREGQRVEVPVEVPVLPPEVVEMLQDLATEAEALAQSVTILARETA